ncbi:MAG TPA: hypothetical protein PLK37_12605 [Terricaulis sp.]|nr:hypothetical protein [Terricaulis sp.]
MPAAIRAVLAAALIGFASACAAPTGGPSAPREIRTGVAESAAQYVESSVSPEEVAAAIQAMIAAEQVCTSWPTLWLQDGGRRTLFIVRYDLMMRDWGQGVAASSQERMAEFVAAGFLNMRSREDLGPGALEYTLTSAGDAALSGSPYSGERPTFCAPVERRLVEITAMEWGQYPCGNLHVRFTHVSDDWPSWARAESTRLRLAQTWPALGEATEGSVTLSRRWYSQRQRGSEAGRGELASVCYDPGRTRIIGDDLRLFSAQP